MSYKPRWDNGGWNVICDACGRKFKENELQLRWDGLMVCKGDWEPRHPQDFVKGVADIQAPKYARPEQTDVFIPVDYDKYPEDQVDVSESTSFNFTKYVNNLVPDTTSVLNGSALNQYVINYSDTSAGGATETVSINEIVQTILGRNVSDTLTPTEAVAKVITKVFSDTISIAESLQLIEIESTVESLSFTESVTSNISKNLSESVSVSESVSTQIISPLTLNGAALNSFRLD